VGPSDFGGAGGIFLIYGTPLFLSRVPEITAGALDFNGLI